MNSQDRKLVEEIALVWVNGGGDADGIDYLLSDIKEAIMELRKAQEK